jgi:hypothetical protein
MKDLGSPAAHRRLGAIGARLVRSGYAASLRESWAGTELVASIDMGGDGPFLARISGEGQVELRFQASPDALASQLVNGILDACSAITDAQESPPLNVHRGGYTQE